MKPVPYWLDTATPFSGAELGPVEGSVDVAVIGGGLTGLSAARALARGGASVAVLEKGKVVGEASGRNGGHVNNGTAHNFAALVESLGLDRARAIYHAFDEAVDTMERIASEEGIACDFRRSGKIKLAAKPEHYEKIARGFELLQREADPEARLVPREALRQEVGSNAFFGGILHPRSAQMHVGRFGAGLAEAATRRGAHIFEDAPVTTMRREAGGHRIVTARGTLRAKQVLLATGASKLGPMYFRRRLVPLGSYVIVTEPLGPDRIAAIMPTQRTATTTRIIGNYFRTTPDGRLVWGGRARFALPSQASDAKSGRVLEAQLRETFPQLGPVRVDYCWGGTIDATQDRLPRAGEQDGIFYATGYSGHGVQMSVHMGEAMAAVMGGRPEANPFRDLQWHPVPGHFGPPWFMPFVGLYYRVMDRIS
ncbi:NAD(P)/FAD-dependent oxidoreductase [Muricoccus pecuniae]|uniref:Glycine/D-amino acid oxidase-like deaminating enzyme n=1 Tax=Muricoccus pecuniae TaxID=693023 RepID=A0A840Y4M3_9PROT|nr:FAD-binding oxidoreductase [Roseomonas pecuniae]MBB5694720.1 glycine/D-amino acid oxidase-like deaminating enzyme [Roseomonas pecuniae]